MKRIIGIIACICMLASMFTFVGTAAGVSVSIVRISMTEPVVGGEKPMDAKVPETASSVVTNVRWEGNFDENGCFVEGNQYIVFVEVGLKDEKSNFKEKLSTLTVNGKNATLYHMDSDRKLIVVSYSYSFPGPVTAEGFTDVKPDAYYASAVKWAVEKGITSGTSATTFSPDNTCTKAQILTFLWRAVGSPKHEGICGFTNLSESDYYYHAAHWASSKNMISGVKFPADDPCTRFTTVFYLWKLAGCPKGLYDGRFTDVKEGTNMADCVGWAVSENITLGTSETTFSPNDTCTRGQIVTFLQRALK